MSKHIVSENSPECKALWKDYMKSWVISEDKKNVCIIFQDHHCTLVIFEESLPDNMKHSSVLHNHEFFLMTAMRDIAHSLKISVEEFYDSETYKADVKFSSISYFC